MNFVKEQYLVFPQIGHQGGQVARPFDDRSRGGFNSDFQFIGDNVSQGGFAQPRWSEKQDMV